MAKQQVCSVCSREEGHKATNRFGEPDVNPDAPLGAMQTCTDCGMLSVCPECLHERECCELREVVLLSEMSSKVGAVIGGAWSIDWLWSEPKRQWFLTDMAEAEGSYHWPECPQAAFKAPGGRRCTARDRSVAQRRLGLG